MLGRDRGLQFVGVGTQALECSASGGVGQRKSGQQEMFGPWQGFARLMRKAFGPFQQLL